jgi:hypothetical protein
MLAPSTIPVVWRDQPFTGRIHNGVRPSGLSIAEIVASVPGLPSSFTSTGIVCVNGLEVPRHYWGQVRPRSRHDFEIVVTLHLPLRGGEGNGSQNKGATIAKIAVLVLATIVTAGAFGPLGAIGIGTLTGAQVLGATIAVAGSLAIAALTPPPTSSSSSSSGASSATADDSKSSASASGNVLSRGGAIPRVVGWHKILPPFAANPLVEIVGDDQFVEAVYILAGPHVLNNILLGSVSIDNIDDLEYEISEGLPSSQPTTLVTRQSRTENPQASISRPQVNKTNADQLLDQTTPSNSLPVFHAVASRAEPDEVWLSLSFSEGITNYNSPTTKMGVPCRIQFRVRGDTLWRNMPEFHFCSKTGLPFQKVIKVKWSPPPLRIPLAPADEAPYLAYKTVPGQTIAPASGGWVADPYFSTGSGGELYSAATFDTHHVFGISLNSDGVEVFLDPAVFAKDTYEFQMAFGAAYTASSFTAASYTLGGTIYDFFSYWISGTTLKLPESRAQIHDKITLSNVSSIWNEHPIAMPGCAVIAIRAKNRQLEPLSTIAGGYVRDWNGTDWGDYVVTDNPAPHYVDVMTGNLNADPLPPVLVDNDGIVAWRQACIDLDYRVNAIIEGSTVDDARTLLAACGFARPRQSERWGILRDKDRSADTPVQIFSPRNLSGFRWERAFPRKPDGFRATFQNADDDYNDDEVIVFRTGVDPANANRLEEMPYTGKVTVAEIVERATFDLAQLDQRTKYYYGSADCESLVCERGDLVGVNHDVIAHWASAARALSIQRDGDNVTGIILDAGIVDPPDNFIDSGIKEALLTGDIADEFLLTEPGVALLTGGNSGFLNPRQFLAGKRTGAGIRLKDGTVITREVTLVGGDADDIRAFTFVSPIADPDEMIVPDALIVIGELGNEYKRLIVFDIRPDKNLTAAMTFVDEAPGLWPVGS